MKNSYQTYLVVGGDKIKRLETATSLRNLFGGSQVDTLLIGNEDVLKIEHVREIINRLIRPPFNSPVFTVILYEMDNATPETQHALLKTLEEPPLYARIIMTASKKEMVIPTVLSRAFVITLPNTYLAFDPSFITELDSYSRNEPSIRFSYASRFTTREEATAWLEKALIHIRYILLLRIKRGKLLETSAFISFLKLMSRAYATIRNTNTNPRLLMENLLLELPTLPRLEPKHD